MVSCKQCQTPNSLDSTFCKRCGAAIVESDLTEAQAKMEQLIEEGNTLFNQGRTDEALAIAEAAVLGNPSSTSGWSLKTLCHERRGEIAEALECADRLVELNPDSDFDKIRRSTLRQKLQTDLHVPATPDRKLAFLGAASAIVLVLCIGAIVARVSGNKTDNSTASRPYTPPSGVLNSGQQPQIYPNVPVTSGNQPANPPANTQPAVSIPNPQPANPTRSYPNENHVELPNYRDAALPGPGELGTNQAVPPVIPNIDPNELGLKPTNPVVPTKQANHTDEGEPKPLVESNAQATTPDKPADTGVYQITIRNGGGPNKGAVSGSEPAGATGIDAMTRVGNQQFLMSNFAAAAKSYEQAIQSGGDAISLNRRLGQTYERLGRNSDAIGAYQRCISAIDGALASGKGDKDRLNSTRGVCDQAIKVLQGG